MNQLSEIRNGRITSSSIVDLLSVGTDKKSPGKPFYTYVQDCRLERFFKSKIESDADTKPMQWGRLCELYYHSIEEDGDYVFQTDFPNYFGATTLVHPKYPDDWVGTPDSAKIEKRVVADTKCPSSKKKLWDLIFPFYDLGTGKPVEIDGNEAIKLIRENSPEGKKYYAQLLSNASILGYDKAELIVFFPKYSTLTSISIFHETKVHPPMSFLQWSSIDSFPHLPDSVDIPEVHKICFDIPEEDKLALEIRVKMAIDLINA